MTITTQELCMANVTSKLPKLWLMYEPLMHEARKTPQSWSERALYMTEYCALSLVFVDPKVLNFTKPLSDNLAVVADVGDALTIAKQGLVEQ